MPNHIIHKQKVTVQTDISADAFTLQNRISNLFKNDLKDKIESLFDQISPNGKTLRIDKLELDLGTIRKENLEAEFSKKIIEQLSVKLSNINDITDKKIKFEEVEHNYSIIDVLTFFLQKGYMPWYSSVKNFAEWESEMLHSFSDKEWILLMDVLRKSVLVNRNIIQRLVMQFSESFVKKILFHLHDELNTNWQSVFFEKNKPEYDIAKQSSRILFWHASIIAALTTANKIDFENALLERMNEMKTSVADKNAKNKSEKKDALISEDLFTNNCGIVILHPFLQMYFKELELLNENDFINIESQHRAVLLLHYLATGETKVAEFNLLLAKLLCAVDFEEPIPNFIELTEKEKEESGNLLKSVTEHWAPLKNTSAEGLRNSFFEREGKLTQTETGWLLLVEQKTIDILLDKLPWGIGTIKLPWMKNTLNVEWC